MANIKSALKRIQISERNRLRNKSYKSAIKTLTKRYVETVEQYAAEPSEALAGEMQQRISATYSKIDKAVKKGILHRNTGARKKSQLAKLMKPQTQAATVSDE